MHRYSYAKFETFLAPSGITATTACTNKPLAADGVLANSPPVAAKLNAAMSELSQCHTEPSLEQVNRCDG